MPVYVASAAQANPRLNFQQAFLSEMHAKGLSCSETPISDGKIHRFHIAGDKPGSKNGWYVLHDDGQPAGSFGSWKAGQTFSWCAKTMGLTQAEKDKNALRIKQAKQQREEQQQLEWNSVAKQYQAMLDNSSSILPDHPYLKSKQIQPNGLRCYQDKLLIPARDTNGNFSGLMTISGDGEKKFLPKSKVSGNYFSIGQPTQTVYICEGVATAATIHQITGCIAVVAFNAANLGAVTKVIQEKYPDKDLVICADDDAFTEGNPGITKASYAASITNVKLAVPMFGESRPQNATDFNDMAALLGADATAKVLRGAVNPNEEWPELVSLDTPDLPSIDISNLADWAGDYASEVSANTETPPELAVGMILAACATACARRLQVMVKQDYFEPCNLWTVVALSSGNRKSSVQASATAPLLAWERDKAVSLDADIVSATSKRKTMEATANENRKKAAKEKDTDKAKEFAEMAANLEAELPDIPTPPHLWTSDATPERLGSLLAENKECIAWLSSEAGQGVARAMFLYPASC